MTARFLCPKCGGVLARSPDGALWRCAAGHCYDTAASGYVNLLDPGRKSNAGTGDSRESVKSRSAFLSRGFYKPLADAVADVLCSLDGLGLLIDAGCGEGYYTNYAAYKTGAAVIGLDASKYAVAHASKAARAAGIANVSYAAANIFSMPLPDECAGAVLSMFAPLPEGECSRVLTQSGAIVMAIAGERHLFELKAAVYDEPRENDSRLPVIDGFELTDSRRIDYTAPLGCDAVRELFDMTPYRYKTSPADAAKLDAVTSLDVTVDVKILVYHRK